MNFFKTKILIFFKFALVIYILYWTILWGKFPFDMLRSNLDLQSKGFETGDPYSEFTNRNLVIFLILKILLVVSCTIILFWKNKWALLLFVICVFPLLIDYVSALSKQDNIIKNYLKELLYIISLLLVVILWFIPWSEKKSQLLFTWKELVSFIVLLTISCFMYYRYNLKF